MLRIVAAGALTLAGILGFVVHSNRAAACYIAAGFSAQRVPYRIEVAQEEALIIWDELTNTEHFIRRASFRSEAPDFGFLVPTPTRPALAEADDDVFTMLEEWTAPPLRPWSHPSYSFARGSSYRGAPLAQVRVIEVKRVAGLDAAVLQANSSTALNDWLGTHAYQSGPELVAWLEPYIKRGGFITAFKFAKADPASAAINSAALRMSFQTEQPFYPYREPPAAGPSRAGWAPSRLLRIYFLGPARVRATLGPAVDWAGQDIWSDSIDDFKQANLLRRSKVEPAAAKDRLWRLTRLEDRSSPRPGTDEVYFTPSVDQSILHQAWKPPAGPHVGNFYGPFTRWHPGSVPPRPRPPVVFVPTK